MTFQTPIKTTDLDTAPLLDEVLGHRMVGGRKRTVRMPVDQLIGQLKAGGAATIGLSDLQPEVGTPFATLLDWIAGDLKGLANGTAAGLANEVAARVAAFEAQARLIAEQAETIAAQAQAMAAQGQALADEAATRSQALSDEARDRAAAIEAEQAERVAGAFIAARAARATMSRVSALGLYVRSLDYSGYVRVETLQRDLTAAIGATSASIREQMTVAASETAAIAERVVTLEASTADLSVSIIEAETARVADNEAFAQRLAAISIGTDNQFDPAKTWTFDTGAEDWSGSPTAPVAANGWLRPADASAAPYIISPSGLAILGSQARQVRALAQRIGAPVWVGRLWWRLAGQTAWASTQSVTIPEPIWSADGEAQITWRPDWVGTIDAIRLDLTSAQSATDAVRLDYVSIGSPSPGASRAELLAEQQARIAADQASASRTDGLTAELAATRQDLTGTAAAVETLTGSVTEAQDKLTAQAGQLATISAELGDKASAEAVDELESEVEALTGATAGLVSQTRSVRAIRASLQPLKLAGIDAAFAAYLAREGALQATAEAAQTMTSKVEATNSSLSIVADIAASTRAALPGKADTSTVDAISSRLTTNESRTTATSTALQQVTATLADKADTSVVDQIEAEVDALTGTTAGLVSQTRSTRALRASLQPLKLAGIDAAFAAYLGKEASLQATAEAAQTMTSKVEATNDSLRIVSEVATSTRAALDGKAETSALATLQSEVTAQGDRLTVQSGAITSLRNDVNDKASGTALASLTQTVTSQGDQITLQGRSLTALSGEVAGKASSGALSALSQTVSDQGDQLTVQSGAITSLRNDVNDKASGTALASLTQTVTSQGDQITLQGRSISALSGEVAGKASSGALSALTQTVTDQGGQISANAGALIALDTRIGNVMAGARYKMEVVNGPSGYVRIGALAAVSAGNQFRTAGWYIDQPIDETQPSQFVVDADRMMVVSGSDKTPVFVIDGSGRAVLNSATIPNLTTDKITFRDGSVQTRALETAALLDVVIWDGGPNGIYHETGITVLGTTDPISKAGEDHLEILGNVRLKAETLAPANAPMNVTLGLYWGDMLVTESYIELMQATERGRDVQIQGYVSGSWIAGTQALQLRISKDKTGRVFIGQRRLSAKRFKRVIAV